MANYTSMVVPAGSSWGISAGDTAQYTSVYGAYAVLSGAADSRASVYDGGSLNVYSGGISVSGSVLQGGGFTVCSSGSVSAVSVSSKGLLTVLSGGLVNGVSAGSGSLLDLRTGALLNNVTLNAGAATLYFTQKAGAAVIEKLNGNTITGNATGVNGTGRVTVGLSGKLTGAVLSGGVITVSSAGIASNTVLSGGLLSVSSAGSALGVEVRAGARLSAGYGAVVSNATLLQGASVNDFTHTGSANALIGGMSGGVLRGRVSGLYFSGLVSAGQGAVLSGVTADAGRIVLGSGASALNLKANTASVFVSQNASVRGADLGSGAQMTLQSGAAATSVTLSSGAAVMEFTHLGGTAATIGSLSGDRITGSAVNLVFSGTMNVGSKGAVSAASVRSEGEMNVFAGGTAVGGAVSAGGEMNVFSGGKASSVRILSGAVLNVSSGANLSGIVQSSGGIINLNVRRNDTTVANGTNELGSFTFSGGTATNAVVYENGSMIASSGAVVRNALIRAGGVMSASLGADVTGSSVDMGIRFSISNGIRSGLNTLSNFVLMVDSGYEINGQVLRGGGVQQVSSMGKVYNTLVSSGGRVEVSYGGSASALRMAQGAELFLDVHGATTPTFVTGSYLEGGQTFSLADGVASGVRISSGCTVNVHSAGTLSAATVTEGGVLAISSGATVLDIGQSGGAVHVGVYGSDSLTIVSGSRSGGTEFSLEDGVASSFLLENNGVMQVFSEGIASGTEIGKDGVLSVGYGGIASGTEVESGGLLTAVRASVIRDLTVSSGGTAELETGTVVAGALHVDGGTVTTFGAIDVSGVNLMIDVPDAPSEDVMVSDLNAFAGALSVSLTVNTDEISEGRYVFAGGAAGFATAIQVYRESDDVLIGTFRPWIRSFASGDYIYTLDESDNTYALVISDNDEPDDPRSNLLNNGYSQIAAWDQARGAVGYVAVDGSSAPAWVGVYNWGDSGEQDMWQALGVGHFQGSSVDYDGILLYNEQGTTFAAWTNLNDPSYGYVSLCHVDGNFMTKCLGSFSDSEYDDVVIYDENGSVGIVSGAAEYHDVWHVDDPSSNVWNIIGAGQFAGENDSLVFLNTSNRHVYAWDNQDPTYATWNWTQTDLGHLEDGWEIAAIGDFQGDGVDDIVIWEQDTGYMFACENGDMNNRRWVGLLDVSGWEVASVGDYNADGKEDLLLRETTTGWGGVGCWASANANNWIDLNARVENNSTSNFAILVG